MDKDSAEKPDQERENASINPVDSQAQPADEKFHIKKTDEDTS